MEVVVMTNMLLYNPHLSLDCSKHYALGHNREALNIYYTKLKVTLHTALSVAEENTIHSTVWTPIFKHSRVGQLVQCTQR